jgi:hypothetical protein
MRFSQNLMNFKHNIRLLRKLATLHALSSISRKGTTFTLMDDNLSPSRVLPYHILKQICIGVTVSSRRSRSNFQALKQFTQAALTAL